MTFISTIMAFALVMIMLATAVSGIVELILRLGRVRASILRQVVKSLVKDVIAPSTKEHLPGDDPGNLLDEAGQAALVEALVRNPTIPPETEKQRTFLGRLFFDGIGFGNSPHVDELSTASFVQRLAKTEAGKALAAQGEETMAEMVKDFSNTFERYTAASSELFRKRAHSLSIVVAIVLAFGANIDATRIVSILHKSPETRELLLKNSDEILKKLEKPDAETKPEQDLQKSVEALKSEIGSLNATYKLPIGWGEYPFCSESRGAGDDARCAEGGGGFSTFLTWVFNALLAGVLIGLGGPFWYRVFSGLSQTAQLLKVFGGRSGEVVSDMKVTPENAEPKAAGEEMVSLFKTSAHVAGERAVIRTDDLPEAAG